MGAILAKKYLVRTNLYEAYAYRQSYWSALMVLKGKGVISGGWTLLHEPCGERARRVLAEQPALIY